MQWIHSVCAVSNRCIFVTPCVARINSRVSDLSPVTNWFIFLMIRYMVEVLPRAVATST